MFNCVSLRNNIPFKKTPNFKYHHAGATAQKTIVIYLLEGFANIGINVSLLLNLNWLRTAGLR